MKQLYHLFTILRTIGRYRLLALLPAELVDRRIRLLVASCAIGTQRQDIAHMEGGTRLRLALQALGPIYIKFGQLLSTRRDMLPPDIADELAKLQDKVEPFDSQLAVKVVEQQLGCSIEEAFKSFSAEPLASASVAQVHAATLYDDSDVVVKIIRPNIEKQIGLDIQLLLLLAKTFEHYSADARRLHLIELVEDYNDIILAELDLKQEAANGSQLKRNFETDNHLKKLLRVPAIHWDFSSDKVLVLERVYGVPISHINTLKENKTNLKLLAERGVEIFFTQVFEHNFFHADMHPGNIFVDTSDPDDPQYIALDCAIMGTLPTLDKYYTARILLGALNRDYQLVARMYAESGWLKPGVNIISFESLIRSICEPIFSKPISELAFGTLLIYLFQAARRFGMEVQPSLALLQKTLVNVEGLGQQLYPELDLWLTAQPFLEKWVEENYSVAGASKNIQQKLPELLESFPALPNRLAHSIQAFAPVLGNSSAQLHQRVDKLEQRLLQQRKLNVTLTLITIIWLTVFFSNL